MKYDWILFDADNTLFDFTSSERKGLQQVFENRKIPFDEKHRSIYNTVNKSLWKLFEKGLIEIDELKIKRFQGFFEKCNMNHDPKKASVEFLNYLANSTDVIKDSKLLLESLYKNYRLAIVTNGATEVQYKRLAATGFDKFFEHIIISQEIGVSKPNKRFFEITFEKIGHPEKSKTLIIGDSLGSDIAGGIGFKIDTCWFNPSKKANESSAQPTYEISYLLDLENHI